MKNFLSALIAIVIFMCAALPVFAEESTTEDDFYMPNQGVEDEIMYLAPGDELEIQLGSNFAYHGFKLILDYGTYPETIYADETGTLKLEIGGSDKYIIRHTGEILNPDETTTFHILGSDGEGLEPSTESTDNSIDPSQEDAPKESASTSSSTETENKDKENNDDSKTKFPFEVIIVIAVLVIFGTIAFFIERKASKKR